MRRAWWPGATTTVAGIVGTPVSHSLSPLLHNAAFGAAGLDWVYVAFPVPEGERDGWVGAARCLGVRGLSVTMPHKQAAARLADVRSATAGRLGAANTLYWEGDRLAAESTDGEGFLASLADEGVELGGRRVVVLGAGGAAKAVALAVASAGAAWIGVVARRESAAVQVAAMAGDPVTVATRDDVRAADVVVNATPVGMAGGPAPDASPVEEGLLEVAQVVVDLVYRPLRTPLLALAEQTGAKAVDGTGMLLHQAAAQFELWTGVEAPVGAMREALQAHLALEVAGEQTLGTHGVR
ncbi:MAG: shikimate dehydrogenase [Actinomycetota bacterium]|nr:shikimate dehydrogenase [Actinomycetota bacterium]